MREEDGNWPGLPVNGPPWARKMTLRRIMAVAVTMAVYLATSCALYRLRTLSHDWGDFYHSDTLLFLLPGVAAGVVSVLILWRLGLELGTAVLVTAGCLFVTFGAFLFIAFNTWGT